MIDLHCHLLPGVDDGSKDMDSSLKLAKSAVKDGITHALLTPHHMNGVYVNHKKDIIHATKIFQNELFKHHIPLVVFPGQEIRINGDLLQSLDDDDILFADTSDKYLMLEFPDDDVPLYSNMMVYDMIQRGIIPIIVHPERNIKIMNHPNILFDLLNMGCLSQVTASSYVGVFGKKIEKFSEQLIESEQVYIFASDAHNLPGRNYEMTNAFLKLNNEFGNRYANRLSKNAKSIINGDFVTPNDIVHIKKRFFNLF